MGIIISKPAYKSKIIQKKIINSNRNDIISNPHNRSIRSAKFTDLFLSYCKKHYDFEIKQQLQKTENLSIKLQCMLPPINKINIYRINKNIINYFNLNDTISIAFIKNPANYNEYVPLKPIFEIIKLILKTMKITYIVYFERIKYNMINWEENNAVLIFYIIQNN